MRVAIIGGGISGLAVGFELLSKGFSLDNLVILEKQERAGGNLTTEKVDGFVIERGPNGFLDNAPATLELIKRVGLKDRLLKSNETSAIRYIYRAGKLRTLPNGPLGLLSSGVLPLGGALRVFFEPLIKKGGTSDESVFDFSSLFSIISYPPPSKPEAIVC